MPVALKELWTPTSRLYDRSDEGHPERKILDCGISWQNYLDDQGINVVNLSGRRRWN